MRRLATAAVLVLSAVLGLPAQQPPRDEPAPAGAVRASIEGRVTVLETSPPLPIRRAKVTLTSPLLAAPLVVDSDTDGRFRFDGLSEGEYRVRAVNTRSPGWMLKRLVSDGSC